MKGTESRKTLENPIYRKERDRKFCLVTGAILLCFYLLGFIVPSTVPNDSKEYLQMADNIYNEARFYCGDLSEPINYDDFTKRPPLYPLFLGIGSLMGSAPFLLYLLQTFLVFAGIFLMRNIGFYMNYKTSYDKWIYLCLVFLPSLWIYPQLMMTESVLFFLLSAMAFTSVQGLVQKSDAWIAIAIIMLGLSTFLKPVMFPAALLVSIIGLLYCIWHKYKQSALASALVFFLILGYMSLNYQRTGAFNFSSISTINLVDYNTYYFNYERGGQTFAQAKKAEIYAGIDGGMTYQEKLSVRRQGALNIIVKHPISYAVFHLKGTYKFFLFPGRYDIFTFFGLDQSTFMLDKVAEVGYLGTLKFLITTTPIWLLCLIGGSFLVKTILFIGFLLFLFHRSVKWQVKFLLYTIILYIALLTGPLGASRFFMPVGSIYLFISVIGLCGTITKLRKGKTR